MFVAGAKPYDPRRLILEAPEQLCSHPYFLSLIPKVDSVTSASSTWGTGRVAKAPVRPARTPLPDAPLQRPYKGMPPSPEPLAASSSDSDLTGATPTLSKQQDVLVETPDYDSFLSKSSINGGNSTMKRPMQRSADDQESPIKKHRVARNKDPATYAVKAKMKLAGKINKRSPVCPPGIIFRWSDNQHNDTEKAIVNQKDEGKLMMTLTDEDGQDWQFPYANAKDFDWTSKAAIARLNNQRGQIIRRRLDRPGDIKDKTPKAPWTTKEKKYLSNLVTDKIRKTKHALTWTDWEEVAKDFNAKFEGVTMAKGERISPAIYRKKDGGIAESKEERLAKKAEDKILSHPHVIVARQYKSIKAQYRRWPDEVQMMDALVASVTAEADDAAILSHEDEEGSEHESEAAEGDSEESKSEEESSPCFPNILAAAA
ncbi:hypothetical protein BDZ45DRAFT_683704 [Acephala macrosclerotiorum]|nr:hypothetical protein BDZ45DRAFT_683704 [Acephala macrosclerotiorum]